MRTCCIAVLILAFATNATAQTEPRPFQPAKLVISERAIAMALDRHPPAPPMQSRDSIKNGAIIGAVIGAVVMGAGVGWLCNELKEPGEPSCWRSVATAGALGAGVGAAGGAGLDALFLRDRGRIRTVSR
jgi:hypothetical protein